MEGGAIQPVEEKRRCFILTYMQASVILAAHKNLTPFIFCTLSFLNCSCEAPLYCYTMRFTSQHSSKQPPLYHTAPQLPMHQELPTCIICNLFLFHQNHLFWHALYFFSIQPFHLGVLMCRGLPNSLLSLSRSRKY